MKSESPPLSQSQRMSPSIEDSDHKFIRDHQTNNIPSLREAPKKNRKNMARWTKHVGVALDGCGTGLESLVEDGYNWRKYGMNAVSGDRYPRSYYRCKFRHVHGCRATKQVEQTNNDEATIFEITYRGRHTCNQISDPNDLTSTAMNQHLPISTDIMMNNSYSSTQAMDKQLAENIESPFDQANNPWETNQHNDLFSEGSQRVIDHPFPDFVYNSDDDCLDCTRDNAGTTNDDTNPESQ